MGYEKTHKKEGSMMKKEIFVAIAYVLVVLVGFTVYDHYFAKKEEAGVISEGQHGHNSSRPENSAVIPTIEYSDHLLSVHLRDESGSPFTELVLNHEKLLHLIIVDEQLDRYYHLHPEYIGEGNFELETALPEGSYKAFIDIKPLDLDYIVEPLELLVGEPKDSYEVKPLIPDTEFIKTINGHTITLNPVHFEKGKELVLDFDLPNTQVEPYLGALGHVVILDETASHYIHVHPHEDDTVFETTFDTPGIYKLWAEFKINGEVNVFPLVFEVK
jgi:hypothetical protein